MTERSDIHNYSIVNRQSSIPALPGWVYASLENGVHISYPGHGGYPTGYDPRKRPWYKMAKQSKILTWLPIVDATTGQLTLTFPCQ